MKMCTHLYMNFTQVQCLHIQVEIYKSKYIKTTFIFPQNEMHDDLYPQHGLERNVHIKTTQAETIVILKLL